MPIEAILTLRKCILLVVVGVFATMWLVSGIISDIEYADVDSKDILMKYPKHPIPGSSVKHLHTFMQVSDLHFSIFYDKKRGPDFEKLINEYMKRIKPDIVLVTGDLTDAKTIDMQGSQQYEDEWKIYDEVLRKTKITEETIWLDTRGNHDAFDVPHLKSDKNFYRKYSPQGKQTPRSYRYQHETKDGDKISFIAVDACPDPGIRRPFNFFGILSKEDVEDLEAFQKQSEGSNMTIWFGHYPTQVIAQPSPGISDIVSKDAVYMCGHLHTLAGLVPSMYAAHKSGNLELELGDWKDNRLFRVFAIDHGIFSFTDETLGTWPVVLVTNPKHAQFNMPQHEPLQRMVDSTHIRVLAYSPGDIVEVKIEIDDTLLGEATHAGDNLYVFPWKPSDYSTGVHTLEVHVKDSLGNQRVIKQPFSLDYTRLQFDLFPRYILMNNHITFVKTVFLLMLLVCVLPLVLLRVAKVRVQVAVSGLWGGCMAKFIQTGLRRLYLVATTDRLFYPLVLFAIYIAIGPWFIGNVLNDHLGLCFVHGIYVKGAYIPGTLTFAYGAIQLLTFNLPLTLYLGTCRDHAIIAAHRPPPPASLLSWLWRNGLFLLLIIWQIYMAFFGFQRAYGSIAFLIGPVRTWSVGLAIWLRRQAMKLDESKEVDVGNGREQIVNGEGNHRVSQMSEDSGIGMSR